jgi:hypothetical protein
MSHDVGVVDPPYPHRMVGPIPLLKLKSKANRCKIKTVQTCVLETSAHMKEEVCVFER